MKKRLISASEMEKEYDEKRALAEKYYIEVLQPAMLAVANEQKFYTIERFGNKWGHEYFPEFDGMTEASDISMYVCEMLEDLGYDYEIIESPHPISADGLVPGYSKMVIRWDK